ncbi:MAG: 3-dehydroquinate synthase [Elusimicrobia bacterium]|nr:3-dehydroquinate synthase [Candidatus Liberimonas magnetica]
MKLINVRLKERTYPILINRKLKNLGSYLKNKNYTRKVLVVTNPKVKKLYFAELDNSLKKAGFKVYSAILPDGERYKTLGTVNKIYIKAIKAGIDRATPVIALGGGVIGDIAGFFASTFLRGIPFIQVPTTLLAMVDSSVGGKTGVDLKEGKNLVGTFYQPDLVWIDISTLKTLPLAEMKNGMAEVIKYGVIKDGTFFKYLNEHIQNIYEIENSKYEAIIAKCCSIKARIVESDEKEKKGIREVLNFGHTFGHAIETLSGYKVYKHGQAVAIGMNMAGNLAVSLGVLSEVDRIRIKNILVSAKLPVGMKERYSFKQILPVLMRDKKVKRGNLRFVLPKKLGSVFVHKGVPLKVVRDILSLKG